VWVAGWVQFADLLVELVDIVAGLVLGLDENGVLLNLLCGGHG
jgi:hypothetical protein